MKLMAISFLILLLIPFVSAPDYTFDYPNSVNLNESFSVSISATASDVYDVKIWVKDNSTSATLSQIYDNGWRNPYNYIISAFPAKTGFEIRVITYSLNAVLCTRLRKTDATATPSAKCNIITIMQSSAPAQTQEEESEQETENIPQTSEQIRDFTPISAGKTQSPENEKIYLSQGKTQKTFTTAEGKLRTYSLYSFIFIIIILCIYLAFKKL